MQSMICVMSFSTCCEWYSCCSREGPYQYTEDEVMQLHGVPHKELNDTESLCAAVCYDHAKIQ